MSAIQTQNKLIVRRIYEDLWNKGNLAVAEEIFSNPEGVKRYNQSFLAAFPDLIHTVEQIVAEEDQVVAQWIARGTHTGDLFGIAPTNQQVTFNGITIVRIKEGKIVAHSTLWDTLSLLEQIRLVPIIRKPDGSRL